MPDEPPRRHLSFAAIGATEDSITNRMDELMEGFGADSVSQPDDLGGLGRHVGGGFDSLAADLADAWLILSNAANGDARSPRSDLLELGFYVPEEWAKQVHRRLRGYAAGRVRPQHWPWTQPEFDDLPWLAEQHDGFRVVDRRVRDA